MCGGWQHPMVHQVREVGFNLFGGIIVDLNRGFLIM